MRIGFGIAMLLGGMIAVAPARTAPAPAQSGTASAPARSGAAARSRARAPKLDAVTLVIRHRVFHDFRDRQRVRLNQNFILGDTEFSARIVQYVPDFQMDLERHRIFSLSPQPNNPAFKIIVRKNRTPQDTTWAFLNNPPHFGARSYFAFQVVQMDFVDHAPLFADTTRLMPGMGASATARDSARKP